MVVLMLLDYRGIVHPLPGGKGTEQTYFAPKQQLRNNVSKRSVHGKQSPAVVSVR